MFNFSKKIVIFGLIILPLSLVLSGCGESNDSTKDITSSKLSTSSSETKPSDQNGSSKLGNPVKEQKSLDDLNKAVGFKVQNVFKNFEDINFSNISNIAQIDFTYKKTGYTLREVQGSVDGDISGDYTDYKNFDILQNQKVAYNNLSNAKVVFFVSKTNITYSLTTIKYNKDDFDTVLKIILNKK